MIGRYFWIGFISVALLGSASVLLTGCGGKDNQSELADKDDLGELPSDTTEVGEATANFIISLPNPIQVANLIKGAGARYEGKILNPESNVNNYTTATDQALNLGVYSADLAFANVYDKKQESLKYFSVVRKLAESVGVGNVFTKDLQNRVNVNQDKQDSLEKIFADTFTRVHSELRSNKREKYLALMFVGGWTESVYIATELWKFNPVKPLGDRIAEQGSALKDLIQMVEQHKSEEGFTEIHTQLTDLSKEFDKMREDYKPGEAKKDPKTETVNVDNKVIFNYTDDQIKSINQKIAAIRKGLVS